MYRYEKEGRIEDEKLRRLLAWYRGGKAGPVQLDVELHRRCNLKCLPCSRRASDFDLNEDSRKNELPFGRWLKLVREAADLGALIWNIEGGGEPAANPDLLMPVMEEVKRLGLYGVITTNGTLWNDGRLRKVVEIGWDRIHFSVDGPTAKEHDAVRGKGNFERTMAAFRKIGELKRASGANAPMLNVNIVINNLNYSKLPEMVKMARSLGADFVFTEPLIIYHKGSARFKLDEAQVRQLPGYIKKAKRLADSYGMDNNFATKDRNLEADLVLKTGRIESVHLDDVREIEDPFLSVPCYKPWNLIAIKYNGLAGHCGLIEKGKNVKKTAIEDVWYGKGFERTRAAMLAQKLPSHCHKCCPSDITQRRRLRGFLMKAASGGPARVRDV